MFPPEAQFICRRCKCHFYFSPEVFPAVVLQKEIQCPKCGTKPRKSGAVERFFKFYPRLVTAEDNLTKSGFEFTSYRFTVDQYAQIYIDHLTFLCSTCGKSSEFPMSRIVKFADEPGLFACKKCKVQASPLKFAKEFFTSLRAVDRESGPIHDFLWDIFSPLQLDPNDYPVQFRIYQSETADMV